MGKKNKNQNTCDKEKAKYYPFVSVCTPTFNRRPFWEMSFEMFRNQNYPKNRIEWIILDDGTDKIRDLVERANIPQIKYVDVPKKLYLGEKRNLMHTYCKGSIIVYWDDDDFYPYNRISHAVERLSEHPEALCAGSSELYIYFKHINKMFQCGPYGPNHSTAGTFAFRKELLLQTKYDDTAAIAEEKNFLKNYTIPFVQLDSMKTILCFSHIHNTFNKEKLLDNKHPQFFKESDKTVNMFIKSNNPVLDAKLIEFFMNDINGLLVKYEPGEPKYKPESLQQIKDIEEQRKRAIIEMEKNSGNIDLSNLEKVTPIVIQNPGQPIKVMSQEEVVHLIKTQQEHIQSLISKITDNEKIIHQLQLQLLKMNKPSVPTTKLKSDPDIQIEIL
jgi:glycosyltransferase involved in cell wall biosynthesis